MANEEPKMTPETFEREIKKGLQNLDRWQRVRFAWLCGVRALPFLGAKGHFEYWNSKKKGDLRQKHLLAVFRALDVAAAYAYDAAYAAAYAAYAAYDAARAAAYAAAYADDAAYAAYAAAYAYDAAYAAARADDAAARADDAAAGGGGGVDVNVFQKILLEDIKAIRAGHTSSFSNDDETYKAVYGPVWDNFQTALADIGCAYWGDLYDKLFENNFVMDKAALKIRLEVPQSTLDLGAAEVARYLIEYGKGAKQFNEARIILLGEKGVGKTALAIRLKNPDADTPPPGDSTTGVDIGQWPIDIDPSKPDGEKITAHIWDFAGHAITHAVHRCFLADQCLYILVYNGRTEWGNRPDYWLEQIKTYGKGAPVIVLINQWDDHPIAIQKKRLKRKYPFIKGFRTVNIKDKTALKRFRKTVMSFLRYTNRKNLRPGSYLEIKEGLQKHFKKKECGFVTLDVFKGIAKQTNKGKGIPDEEIDSHLGILHSLGICLHYDNEKDNKKAKKLGLDKLVFNPDWISTGIYKLIDWGSKTGKEFLPVSAYQTALATPSGNAKPQADPSDSYSYSPDGLERLLDVMEANDLAFRFPSVLSPGLFVPLLLPVDERDNIPFDEFYSAKDRLRRQYAANQPLPPNIVAQLIVNRQNELLDKNQPQAWRYGAILHACGETENGEKYNATALVEEEERAINLYVKGPHKEEYCKQLQGALNAIFKACKISKPELREEILVPKGEDDPKRELAGLRENERPMVSAEVAHAYQENSQILQDIIRQLITQDRGSITINNFNFNEYGNNLQHTLKALAQNIRAAGEENTEVAQKIDLAAVGVEKCQNAIEKNPDKEAAIQEIKENRYLDPLKTVLSKTYHGYKVMKEFETLYGDIIKWSGFVAAYAHTWGIW